GKSAEIPAGAVLPRSSAPQQCRLRMRPARKAVTCSSQFSRQTSWRRHDAGGQRPVTVVGWPVRHRKFRRWIEHGGVHRTNLCSVDEEPFAEHVARRWRTGTPNEYGVRQHRLRFDVYQWNAARNDHCQVEAGQAVETVARRRRARFWRRKRRQKLSTRRGRTVLRATAAGVRECNAAVV